MYRPTTLGALLLLALLAACSSGVDGNTSPAAPEQPAPDRAGADLRVSAYVVPWDGDQGVLSWRAGADRVVSTVSPVWLNPTADGGLVRHPPRATSVVVAEATDAAVVPSVSNFVDGRWDGELVAALVGDPTLRRRHVEAITTAVRNQGWDGVDVDYESLPLRARDDFTRFVSELGEALRAENAELTVTLQAKTANGTEGPQAAQDWAGIAEGADRVRVMAYDHAWSTSGPGPVAPLAWVEDVLAYAVGELPPEKVELGIGTYGYDWTGRRGRPVSWREAVALADRHGTEVRWDEASASAWFRYRDRQGRQHVVWFENARSARLKSEAATQHGVDHLVLWQLGGADPRLWEVLDR